MPVLTVKLREATDAWWHPGARITSVKMLDFGGAIVTYEDGQNNMNKVRRRFQMMFANQTPTVDHIVHSTAVDAKGRNFKLVEYA